MDTKRDYYEVLGIERTSSTEEIKVAYRRLARKFHPDIAENKIEAEAKFKEINEAYTVLSDSDRKQRYDQFGHDGVNSGINMGDFMGGGFDFGDIFSQMFDMFDMNGRGYSGAGQKRPRRGSDLRYDMEITLEEAFKGLEKEFSIENDVTCGACKGNRTKDGSTPEVCSRCKGTGQVTQVTRSAFGQIMRTLPCDLCRGEGSIIKDYCPSCGGSGKQQKTKTLNITIPPGVDTGSRIRISGEGAAGSNGGDSGDLYVVIFIKEHEKFQRSGTDLYNIKHISFAQATLGDELTVETIDGETKLKIPEGTQCDTVFKIKGKGMPSLRNNRRGDLYIKVWIVVPQKLDEKQKQSLKEFDKLMGNKCPQGDPGFFKKLKETLKKAIN